MGKKKEVEAVSATGLDVYERARVALVDLIDELKEALDEQETTKHKRQGYEMIGTYFRQPVNTGDLTLVFASVLEDILHKLELTQQGENVSMVRGEYSVMKKDDDE